MTIYAELDEAREVADLLAETLEVALAWPERLEECGRVALVAYRHIALTWQQGTRAPPA